MPARGLPPLPDIKKYFREVILLEHNENSKPNDKSYTTGELQPSDAYQRNNHLWLPILYHANVYVASEDLHRSVSNNM
jgi:hypothetical protein